MASFRFSHPNCEQASYEAAPEIVEYDIRLEPIFEEHPKLGYAIAALIECGCIEGIVRSGGTFFNLESIGQLLAEHAIEQPLVYQVYR